MIELTIICDGGSLGNGSPDSIGYGSFMIHTPTYSAGKIHQRQFGTGITNSEAEYMAFIAALKHVRDAFTSVAANLKAIKINIHTDSQMVIGHIRDHWKTKPHLVPLRNEAVELCDLFEDVVLVKISGEEMKQILGH
jgi:ribonuclease HI